jgi:hypothetical protein
MITHDTFDKAINSLGTGKVPGPDGIPNEIIKFLPPATRSALFSLLFLLAHKSYIPPEWLNGAIAPHAFSIRKVTQPSSTTTAP